MLRAPRQAQPPLSKPSNDRHIVKQWENMNPPFATGPSRYFIVGTSNTGKTTLAIRIIKQLLRNVSDPTQQLVIISPNYNRDPKLQNLAQYAADSGLIVKVFPSFDKSSMEKFVAYMDGCALQGLRSRVFIDDPVGVGSFTSNVNQKSPFNSFVTGVKHFNADIIFSTQATGSMSKSARKNIDVFIFLPDINSREELYSICHFVSTLDEFDKLMDTYAIRPFNALWINVQYGRKGVYHINEAGNISPITGVPK